MDYCGGLSIFVSMIGMKIDNKIGELPFVAPDGLK
jgi:hypothetical protein